jgi:putative nucleotidyltransferase with HDIG domain
MKKHDPMRNLLNKDDLIERITGMLEAGEQRLTIQEEPASENHHPFVQGRDLVLSTIARADEIAGTGDTSQMVQDMLDLMIEVSLADSANFFQLDAAADELIITHVRGDAESQYLIGLRLNCQQGLPGISLYDTKIMVIGDLLSDPDWLRTVDPVNAARKKNVINLPVVNKDHTLGVIQIFNFQQAELDLLMVLGSRLAYELDWRKEMAQIQRSKQRLLTLVEMLGEVAGTLDRNHLLHQVTENAARLVDAERSSLFLVDPSTSEMVFQVAYQPPAQGQLQPLTDNQDKPSRYSRTNPHSRNYSIRSSRPAGLPEGEFSYFNRSAITVPLRSEPLAKDQAEVHEHVLGGLMVLNKPRAAFQEEDAQLVRILADQASTFLQIAEMYESSEELFLGVIKSLITAIDAKDPYTQGHSQRVSDYSVLIAQELGLDETLVNDIRIGSLLHDIGKIGISDSILLKNGTLNIAENELMREHPRTGANILSQVKLLDPMRPAILEHHERLDGSGYPAKLTDKQISWMGRIVAVADVFDAMTSNRPYRLALSVPEVLAYLHEKAGILFDAPCVEALDNILARMDYLPTH